INKEAFSIGSGKQNDLSLEDTTISKRHCEIVLDENGYLIRDLDSTNGTTVQGVKVATAYLHPGAEFQLGKTRIVFCPLQEEREVQLSRNESFGTMLGRSVAMRRIFYLAETYAPTDATVMITGETGTGKEILAEEIHRHSQRAKKPFIVIDCAAMAKDLIESELFGHVKGAFTGANADRQGAFEHADGGTVFLDEIGDLSPELQPKLLRVLEKREIRRVGDNRIRKIDVRIVCATNRRLDQEVNAGRFREDLYYRLSVVQLELPPLRRRKEDLPLLVKRFLTDLHGADAVGQLADFDATMDVLKRHEWPGNVRELRNLIEVAFYAAHRPVDLTAFLGLGRFRPERSAEPEMSFTADRPFKDAKNDLIEDFERGYLQDLLTRNKSNVSKAAREAGIERAYLQRLIRKYGLK
ncbi:MAG: sigma 54-interacting transcriptional regulator, partial [Kiritimatiellae bacterium]|nr:sigma 54-interacting transcriptional regulator [Kiritimatiellia bacterium]